MACITRSFLRWGLLGALALGGVTLLVGPDTVAAGFAQMRAKAANIANDFVDDPVALRHQLVELGEEYPEKIAEVRGELASVDRQLLLLSRDSEVARRVVANTTSDLTDLKEMLAEAESTASKGIPVSIRTRGSRFSIDEARTEARRVADIRIASQDRLSSNTHQVKFLEEQKARLESILEKLATEYGDFETKLAQIDRQIDAIERNDRLIEMTKQQKAILADYEKFGKVGNLNQLESKLAELQAVQEAQLDALSKAGVNHDYEREARRELGDEKTREADPFDGLEGPSPDEKTVKEVKSTVAYIEPVVIEKRK